MFTNVFLYEWVDVAPSKHPFDLAKARLIVEGAVKQRETIHRVLLREYGPWIYGWEWGLTESSVTADVVLNGMMRWRRFLEKLEAHFAAIPAPRSDIPLAFRKTLENQIQGVVQTAGASFWPFVRDGEWPNAMVAYASWFLESLGLNPSEIRLMVESRITFKSHNQLPTTDAIALDQFRSLGRGLSYDHSIYSNEKRYIDIATWMTTREPIKNYRLAARADDANDANERSRLRVDGHQHFINGVERLRDQKRSDAMAVALDACRASAAAGETLTFERLSSWHRIALNRQTEQAETEQGQTEQAQTAHARPPLSAEAVRLFDSALNHANDARSDIALRASLAYLDVCAVRPFLDGNRRAARLALDHTLTRAGLGLHAAEPVFAIPTLTTEHDLMLQIVDDLIGSSHGDEF